MSIAEKINFATPREFAGSESFNRYEYQLSFATLLLLESIKTNDNFVLLIDYLDDIVFMNDITDPTQIDFYQVKTNKKMQINISSFVSEKWLEKMKYNLNLFDGEKIKSVFATNSNIEFNFSRVKSNRIKGANDFTHDTDGQILLDDLIELTGKKEEVLDYFKKNVNNLSNINNIYILKTNMSIDTHQDTVFKGLFDYLIEINDKLDLAAIKGIFHSILVKMNELQSEKYKPSNIQYNELIVNKGFTRKEFEKIVEVAKEIMIPADFNVIYNFAKNILHYEFNERNYSNLKMLYREFSKDALLNKETFLLINGAIKKIDLSNFNNQELFYEIHSKLSCDDLIKELELYKKYYEFMILLFIYK